MSPFKINVLRKVIRIGEAITYPKPWFNIVMVQIYHSTGDFGTPTSGAYVNITSGTTTVKSKAGYISGNKKFIVGIFATDKFALITGTASVDFGVGGTSLGTVSGFSVASLPALDPVYNSLGATNGTDAVLSSLFS